MILFALALGLSALGASKAAAEPPTVGTPWEQKFSDDFNGSQIDSSKWNPTWPGQRVSDECTDPSLVRQADGYMYLKVERKIGNCPNESGNGATGDYRGAVVQSNPDLAQPNGGYSYKYGYVEWRVYLPGWLPSPCPSAPLAEGCIVNHPGVWSIGPDNHELDVAEGLSGGIPCYTYHYWKYPVSDSLEWQGCDSSKGGGWHTFGLDWEPNSLTFYYDGQPRLLSVPQAYIPTDKQFLIAQFIPPHCSANGSSCRNPRVADTEMKIDYVRVWQHLAPSITAAPASEVTFTTAKLQGWLNPNGSATNFYFQYGPTTSYGSISPAPPGYSAGSGYGGYYAAENIGNLDAGTTYHYRLVASSAGGTTYGEDRTFTTPYSKPDVSTGLADEVEAKGARLIGWANPHGAATTYLFQYGKTEAYGGTIPIPSGTVGKGTGNEFVANKVTELAPNTTYHYRIIASNSFGTSYGQDLTFTTESLKPDVSTGLADEIGTTSARLIGWADPNGTTTNYQFQYGKTEAFGNSIPLPMESVGAGHTPVFKANKITGLSPNTTYLYRIVAGNAYGTSYGQVLTFTTEQLKPDVSTGLADEIETTAARLIGWADPNGTATNYQFQYGKTEAFGNSIPLPMESVGAGHTPVFKANKITGLVSGTTYLYRIVAGNAYGTSYGQVLSFKTK